MSICWGLAIADDDALENSVDVLVQETLEALEGVLRERLARWSAASVVEALESCIKAVQARLEEA